MERKGLLSSGNGLLSILLSLVVSLGVVSAAAAKPRHHGHHAKAVTADRGGVNGASDGGPQEGKGPDKPKGGDDAEGHGSANGQSNGNGQGSGNGNGQGQGN